MNDLSQGDRWVHGIAPDPINRERDDYYPTPPEATRPILDAVPLPRLVGEPCCGEGHIARELVPRGHRVIASDLVNRGYGDHPVDFLSGAFPPVPAIITNPPFKHWEPFARMAQRTALDIAVLFGRVALISGSTHAAIFRDPIMPLAATYYFTRRVRIWRGRLWQPGDGAPMVDFAWFVFRRDHVGPPSSFWLDPG